MHSVVVLVLVTAAHVDDVHVVDVHESGADRLEARLFVELAPHSVVRRLPVVDPAPGQRPRSGGVSDR